MVEAFGVSLGTPFQGVTAIGIMSILGLVLRAWVVGIPDRLRAANEGKVSAAAELADRFKAWRAEVHGLKNEIMALNALQAECVKLRASSDALNEQLMFLIELMISELEVLDPNSKTVHRARSMFARMAHILPSDNESDALHTAKATVMDAKQTLASARETCEEVQRTEGSNGK